MTCVPITAQRPTNQITHTHTHTHGLPSNHYINPTSLANHHTHARSALQSSHTDPQSSHNKDPTITSPHRATRTPPDPLSNRHTKNIPTKPSPGEKTYSKLAIAQSRPNLFQPTPTPAITPPQQGKACEPLLAPPPCTSSGSSNNSLSTEGAQSTSSDNEPSPFPSPAARTFPFQKRRKNFSA